MKHKEKIAALTIRLTSELIFRDTPYYEARTANIPYLLPMPLEDISIVKRIALFLLMIGMIYFGGYNHHFPRVLFAVFALFDVMIFMSAILPVLKAGTFRRLKQANLYNKSRIPLLLIYTLVIFIGIVQTGLGSQDHLLVALFWFVKVLAALFLVLVVAMQVLLDDVILRPED